MQCKTVRISQELKSADVNPWLPVVLYALDAFFTHILKKKMTVTCVLRTPEDQVARCNKHNFKSGFQHCVGEAADIRSRNLGREQIDQVIKFANRTLGGLCKLGYHTKKTPPHFHVGLIKPYSKRDVLWALIKNTPGAESCILDSLRS